MKLYDAFWMSWTTAFAGLIGAAIGVWISVWYPNPTIEGFLVIVAGFVVMVILLTILHLTVDYVREKRKVKEK